MKISTVLATKGNDVVTIQPEQTIKEAAIALARNNIGALVVVDRANWPVGIISERDIVREAARNSDVLAESVSNLMTRGVVTGTPNDDVQSVLQTMTQKHFRHLPIMDEGHLAGIVSIGDMVKAQLIDYQGQIDTLEIRVTGG